MAVKQRRRNRYRTPGASSSAASLLAALDKRLSNRLFVAASGVPRWAYRLLEYGGDGIVWLLLTLAAIFMPTTPPPARALWANFLLGLLLDLALVGSLKVAFRRARPVYNRASDFVVVVAVDRHSFPSGHSSRASFVAAFALACLPALDLRLRLCALLWALVTALSRAAMGRHYLGDVLAGLVVGVTNVAILTKGHFSPGGFWLDEATTVHLYSMLAPYAAPLLPR